MWDVDGLGAALSGRDINRWEAYFRVKDALEREAIERSKREHVR